MYLIYTERRENPEQAAANDAAAAAEAEAAAVADASAAAAAESGMFRSFQHRLLYNTRREGFPLLELL